MILLIEDEDAIARLVEFALEREGFEVQRAADGKEALGMLDKDPPALIVSDIMLPYVSGHEIVTAVRDHERWREVPILMLTSMTGQRDIVRALDSGANDYITKPFAIEELLARVRRLLPR
jgi:two-component system phosphate regulon response regulator PhoB